MALSATQWSGPAGPWDGSRLELWRWTVWLTAAAAVAALWMALGPARLRFSAATMGAVLALVAGATWLRQWWLLGVPHPTGWWAFDGDIHPITVAISDLNDRRAPVSSSTLTGPGYAAGVLLLVAIVASLWTVVRLVRRPAQSAG